MSADGLLVAVVLAGGASRRFGSDKLATWLDGSTLLERAIDGLPEAALVIVVGPVRPLRRAVGFVREEPPGGGPAAALVAGVRAALDAGADEILVLPGDAPAAGSAAVGLWRALRGSTAAAVMGTDATGFEQPLQLALRRSAGLALVAAAGTEGARGGSARALVRRLDPPAIPWPLAVLGAFDIDTPEQLQAWRARDSLAVRQVLAAVDHLGVVGRPVVVALDGRSGAGKSTLAASLALTRQVVVLPGDDFASPQLARLSSVERERLGDGAVAGLVIDWRRLRAEALVPLRGAVTARFRRYDWEAGDGRLGAVTELLPQDVVVVEGVYSARPELADLVDLAVCVDVEPAVRRERLARRLHDPPAWVTLWERGESHYFADVRPVESFDLVVS